MPKLSLTLLATLLAAGCATQCPPPSDAGMTSPDQQAAADIWILNSVRDAAIRNAIIRQHALFPYHFEADRPTLNPLGQKELAVLTEHFKGIGGEIVVRRGDANDDLYKARLDTVRVALSQAGVETPRITLSDAFPGGAGVSSERMVKILTRAERTTPLYEKTTGTVEVPAVEVQK